MKKTIPMIIKKASLICCFCLLTGLSFAQVQTYPEIYPEMPFDLKTVADLGNSKCTVWKGRYKQASGDESGYMWSTPIVESYQYQRYIFPDGKMDKMATYVPIGDKLWTMEYFYKQGLLSAIEKLKYDTLQESSLDFTYAYFYTSKDVPFQRVKMFGHPNKSIRVLEEFEFDTLNRVRRQKTTAVGQSPHMDSLVGLKDKEKMLMILDYKDTTFTKQVYKNLYVILEDQKTYYNEDKLPRMTEVRNSGGEILYTIQYEYENGKLYKKTHWVNREILEPVLKEIEEDDKKTRKSKNKKKKAGSPAEEDVLIIKRAEKPKPEIYKLEYFTYNSDDGLLEMHIIEENGIQTVYEYTFFEE